MKSLSVTDGLFAVTTSTARWQTVV